MAQITKESSGVSSQSANRTNGMQPFNNGKRDFFTHQYFPKVSSKSSVAMYGNVPWVFLRKENNVSQKIQQRKEFRSSHYETFFKTAIEDYSMEQENYIAKEQIEKDIDVHQILNSSFDKVAFKPLQKVSNDQNTILKPKLRPSRRNLSNLSHQDDLKERCQELLDGKIDSNIKFLDQEYFSGLEVKISKMQIKESSIPLQVLYNPQVERIKKEDKDQESDIRPLTFTYRYDPKTRVKVGVKIDVIGDDKDVVEMLKQIKMNQDYAFSTFLEAPAAQWVTNVEQEKAEPPLAKYNRRQSMLNKEFIVNLMMPVKALHSKKMSADNVFVKQNNLKVVDEQEQEAEDFDQMFKKAAQQQNSKETKQSEQFDSISESLQSSVQHNKRSIQKESSKHKAQRKMLHLDDLKVKMAPRSKMTLVNLDMFTPQIKQMATPSRRPGKVSPLNKRNLMLYQYTPQGLTPVNNKPLITKKRIESMPSSPGNAKEEAAFNSSFHYTATNEQIKVNTTKRVFAKWYLKPEQLSTICKSTFSQQVSPRNEEAFTSLTSGNSSAVNKKTTKQVIEDIKQSILAQRTKKVI